MPTRSGIQFHSPNRRPNLLQNRPPLQHQQQQEHIQGGHENVTDIDQIYSNIKSIPNYSSKILEFLRTNQTPSVHKRIIRKFRRRQTVAHYPYDLCMADLAFFTGPGMARANGGNKYILVFIDVFTKMCYVEPLKDKHALTTLVAFEKIFSRLPYTPNHIITDVGTEFYNWQVQKLFKENGIVHYSLRGQHKASVAERMIQTLKGRLEKYFWKNKTKRYLDVLQTIVDNYNKTPHRSIGMAPVKVNRSNTEQVFKKMYKDYTLKIDPRLRVGDKVRIARLKTIFEKGYTRRWSLELYTIVSAKSRGGVDYYKVADESGNILPRQRYYFELNLVKRNDS